MDDRARRTSGTMTAGRVTRISLVVTLVSWIGLWALTVILPKSGLQLRELSVITLLGFIGVSLLVFQLALAFSGTDVLAKSDLAEGARRAIVALTITLMIIVDLVFLLFAAGMAFSYVEETGHSTKDDRGRHIIELSTGFLDPYYEYYEAYGPFIRSDESVPGSPHRLFTDETGTGTRIEEPERVPEAGPVTPIEQDVPTVIPDPVDSPDEVPTGQPYYSTFLDASMGFRMYSSATASTLQRTTDAGATWETVGYPAVGDDEACRFVHGIVRLEDGTLHATVGYPSWIEAGTTVTAISDDDGLTWTRD